MKRFSAGLGIGLLALSVQAFAAGHGAHWSYEGHEGVEHWGDLDPSFALCKTGKQQSPVDIKATKAAKLPALEFNYAAGAAEVVNNGHTIQINVPAGSSLKIGNEVYDLVQFHFHAPSEESVDGKAYPLNAHFVHKNAAGKLAVVGVFFALGKENAALKEAFAVLPRKAGDSAKLAALDPAAVLPADRAYYAYAGSLTTPPCSEGVRWQVLKTPVEISAAQFASYKALYPLNARPLQKLNGRTIQSSN